MNLKFRTFREGSLYRRAFFAFTTLYLLFFVFSSYSFAEIINLSVRPVDSSRVRLSWRVNAEVILDKGMRIRFERNRASSNFHSILEIPAKRSGRVVVRKSSSRPTNFRARLIKQRKTIGSSSIVTIIQSTDDVVVVTDPVDTGSSSGGVQSSPPNITLLDGEAFCPEEVVNQALELVNLHRVSLGLKSLSRNAALDHAAKKHSLSMLRSGQLTHDGWFDSAIDAGYSPGYLAQNIASIFTDPSALVAGWLSSGGHRHNIESQSAIETGISCVYGKDGTWWWAHYFGAPLT